MVSELALCMNATSGGIRENGQTAAPLWQISLTFAVVEARRV